jgi:hypothetical protein
MAHLHQCIFDYSMMQKLKENNIKTQFGRIPDDPRIDNHLISVGKTIMICMNGYSGEYDELKIIECNVPNNIDITTESGMEYVAKNNDKEFWNNFEKNILLNIDLDDEQNAEYNDVAYAVKQCYNTIMQHVFTSSSSRLSPTERV